MQTPLRVRLGLAWTSRYLSEEKYDLINGASRMIQGSDLPRPTVGMIAPVLSVTEVVAGMLTIVVGTSGGNRQWFKLAQKPFSTESL